jgi:hypothetical protein
MCREGAITSARAARAEAAPARGVTASACESRAHHAPLRHGLMLMVTAPRKLEWAWCKTKWPLYLITVPLLAVRISAVILKIKPYVNHGGFSLKQANHVSCPSPVSPQIASEIRIQKLAREGTWNRLKGRITILYALCTHSISCRWYLLATSPDTLILCLAQISRSSL